MLCLPIRTFLFDSGQPRDPSDSGTCYLRKRLKPSENKSGRSPDSIFTRGGRMARSRFSTHNARRCERNAAPSRREARYLGHNVERSPVQSAMGPAPRHSLRMSIDPPANPFQVCGACKCAWQTWDMFVRDPHVRLLGLQSVASERDCNLLIFEHSCGSSTSVLARRLRHLLPETESDVALPVLFGTIECPGHCRSLEDLEACVAACGNARDRALILIIQCLRKAALESANTFLPHPPRNTEPETK